MKRASLRGIASTALAMAMIGCTTMPSSAPPQSSTPFGWLADLAGACWRQNDFGADVCYWQADESNLYWFSRNRDELLGCGKFAVATAASARGAIHSWDEDSADTPMSFSLTGDTLVTDENSESPQGTTRRISRDRFSIQDRPGKPVLLLTRKGSLVPVDAAIGQCLAWEAQRR